MKFFVALCALLVSLAALPASGQQAPNIPILQVPPGPAGATVTGQAGSANPALYYVAGTYGQTLSVSVTSAGNNASFQVYHPDTTVARGANGQPVIAGRTLPDAGASDNAAAWIGSLPGPGNYLIVVGAKSGSADFQPDRYATVGRNRELAFLVQLSIVAASRGRIGNEPRSWGGLVQSRPQIVWECGVSFGAAGISLDPSRQAVP